MTVPTVHVCRACDGEITNPEDAVAVGQDLGNSGPGWTIWAHRDHVDLVDTIDPDLLRIMLRIWAVKAQQPEA